MFIVLLFVRYKTDCSSSSSNNNNNDNNNNNKNNNLLYCFVGDIIADVGGMVTIYCFTKSAESATWSYQKTTNDKPDDICNVNGYLMNGFSAPRFSLIDTANDYHFVIANVTVTDGGFYICTDNDGYGDKHVTRLIVLGNG